LLGACWALNELQKLRITNQSLLAIIPKLLLEHMQGVAYGVLKTPELVIPFHHLNN